MHSITYSHEHMLIDLSKEKNDSDCYLNVFEQALDELKTLKKLGVDLICDCTNNGIGKNYALIDQLQDLSGIKILKSTGFYKDPFLPSYVEHSSIEDLVEIMMKDVNEGACVIGEIGTSLNKMTPNEEKVFIAASLLFQKTKMPIITHTTLGTCAFEQIALLKKYNVDLKKVIISHLALKNDLSMIEEVLKTGCNVAFDTIGKKKYLPDETRVTFLKYLIEQGYRDQLLMSMDLTRKSHLKINGGPGYAYLLETFVPLLLKQNVKEEDIEHILCHNMKRIIGGF